jgi:hypothetical protein
MSSTLKATVKLPKELVETFLLKGMGLSGAHKIVWDLEAIWDARGEHSGTAVRSASIELPLDLITSIKN